MKKLFVLMLLVLGSFGLMACGGDDDSNESQDIVDDAMTRAGALFVDTGSVTQGMNLPKAFMIDDNEVTVEWSSDNADVVDITETTDNYRMSLNRPEYGEGNATVNVTASFEYDGETGERSWELTITELPESDLYTDFDELHANASSGDNLEVEGIVVAEFSGGYFITDGTLQLGVYSGGLNANVGDRVNLVGSYDSYYTLFQITDVTETIIEEDVDYTLVKEELTITEINELDSDDDRTIPGKVYTVTALLEERTPGEYTNMFLIDGEEMAQIYHYGTEDSLAALEDNYLGQMVTMDVIYYTDHGDFVYLLFYGDEDDVTTAELSDNDKAEVVKNDIDLGNTDMVLSDVELPESGDYEATISWASDDETVVDTDGTVTRPTDDDATVTLTATVTVGDASVTKDFTLLVKDTDFESSDVADAIAAEDEDMLFIEGIVTSYKAYGGGFFIEGTDGDVIYVADLEGVEVGNLVEVSGTRDTYAEYGNDRAQLIDTTLITNDDGDHSDDITVITDMTLEDIITALDTNAADVHSKRYRVSNPVFLQQTDYNEMMFEGTTDAEDDDDNMNAFFDIRNYGQYLNGLLVEDDTIDFIEFTVYEVSFGNLKLEGVVVPDPSEAQIETIILEEADIADTEISDLTLPESIDISTGDYTEDAMTYTISWASSDTDVIDTDGTVTRPTDSDATVTLTATVDHADITAFDITIDVVVTAESDNGNGGDTGDIFISEYIEGSGNNKAVEIYNPTDSDIDLSDYSFKLYANGADTTDQVQDLTGTLAAGETLVIVNSNAEQALLDLADITANYPNNVANFNGDDAFELIKDGTVIDVFGVVGETDWAGDLTADHTLVRKSTVTGPSTTWSLDDWNEFDQDTFDNLGSHTMD
ncbi:MAG: immunoglobulin-like domain-containing protein [Bacillota bacterium]